MHVIAEYLVTPPAEVAPTDARRRAVETFIAASRRYLGLA